MVAITRAHVLAWAERYFLGWKTNDRATIESLFSDDAIYSYGPFREPARGRAEIVARWIGNPPSETSSAFEVVAVEDPVAVIHWRVRSDGSEMDGVLILRFDVAGLCCEHREWYSAR